MCFRSAESPFRILEGRLYQRKRLAEGEGALFTFKRPFCNGDGSTIFRYEELELLYRGMLDEWVSIFKYLGTHLVDTDVLCYPRDMALTNARKADGTIKSVAGSTLVLPSYRLGMLHQSLASSLALVNAAAWAPRVYATPAWADTEAGF